MNDNSQGNGALMGFMLGAVVGAATALLMAPESGADTRHRIATAARKLGRHARDVSGDLAHDAKEALEAGQSAFQESRSKRETSRHGV